MTHFGQSFQKLHILKSNYFMEIIKHNFKCNLHFSLFLRYKIFFIFIIKLIFSYWEICIVTFDIFLYFLLLILVSFAKLFYIFLPCLCMCNLNAPTPYIHTKQPTLKIERKKERINNDFSWNFIVFFSNRNADP